jgi:hypothetical protein
MSPSRARAVKLSDGSTTWSEYQDIGATAPPPPPPPPGSTIFGFNTSDSTRNLKLQWWPRLCCGRGYYGYGALPATGNGFAPGGKEYKLAALDVAGVVSSKRVNVSSRFHPGDITSSSSAKVIETVNYVKSIPAGWEVIIGHHEYNKTGVTAAQYQQYVDGFKFLSAAVYAQTQLNLSQGKGYGRYVVNAGGAGIGPSFDPDTMAPNADDMAPDAWFGSDAYDNPSGFPNGYKNYGTGYNDIAAKVLDDVYDIAEHLGYLSNLDGGDRGWWIGEFNSPRRVAPKLTTLDTNLGWGPLSPHDLDGTGQAQAITDYCEYCLGNGGTGRTVPARLVLLWLQPGGANWNQDFSTAGAAQYDDPGAHHQGWPIAVDPTKPRIAYKHYIDISAA